MIPIVSFIELGYHFALAGERIELDSALNKGFTNSLGIKC